MSEENFKKKSYFEKKKMPIEKLTKYYAEVRKEEYKNGKELSEAGIKFRKKTRFIPELVVKADRLASKEKIVIIGDEKNLKTDKPKIFACCHVGGNDVQRALDVIDTSAYLLLGDPGEVYRMFIYNALKLNGVIPLEIDDKEDRHLAYLRSVELLKKGGNLLIFPEGAWNVHPTAIVNKTFKGAVRMAKETGAEIIPIGMEQYDDTFVVNIGKNYSISKDTYKSEDELNKELRDKLATLKWEIMEHMPKATREELPTQEEFQQAIVDRCNFGYGFTLDDVFREQFHDKYITEPEEVYGFLDSLDINSKNAFLAKDKLELVRKKK